MRRIALTLIILVAFLVQSCRAQTVFTFECFCGYLTADDNNCDICTPTLQSRMFSGIIIRKSGTPYKWIDAPYTVKFTGQTARFQELVYPNPETVNIDRALTAYGTLDSFKLAIDCPCMAGGGRDTLVIDSSGVVCQVMYFYPNDTAAIASPLTDQYDYYLPNDANYYGIPAGLVKLAWEPTLPDSASAPGCGACSLGTVTSFSFIDGGGFTGTVTDPTTHPALSLVLQNAAADGTTKGQATFTASDFNASSGVISLDYTNGQKANASIPGFLSPDDWTTFNNKVTANSPITGATKTKITYDLKGLVTGGANATTSDITEGSRLYYTDDRNDDRTAALIQNNTGITWTYNDGAGTLTPTLSDNSATNELQTISASGSGPFAINLSGAGGGSVTITEGTGIDISRTGDDLTINSTGGGDYLGTGFTGGGGIGYIPDETVATFLTTGSFDAGYSGFGSLFGKPLAVDGADGNFFGFYSGGGTFFGSVQDNVTSEWKIKGLWSGTTSAVFDAQTGGINIQSFDATALKNGKINTSNAIIEISRNDAGKLFMNGSGVELSARNNNLTIGAAYSVTGVSRLVQVNSTNSFQNWTFTNSEGGYDFQTTTGALILPNLTTAERDALTPGPGWTLFCTDCTADDSSTGVEQTYNGSVWKNKW